MLCRIGRGGDDRAIGNLVDDLGALRVSLATYYRIIGGICVVIFTFLSVEFAVKDSFDHVGSGQELSGSEIIDGRIPNVKNAY